MMYATFLHLPFGCDHPSTPSPKVSSEVGNMFQNMTIAAEVLAEIRLTFPPFSAVAKLVS